MSDNEKYALAVLVYLPLCAAAYKVFSLKQLDLWLRFGLAAAILVAGMYFMGEAGFPSPFAT